MSQKPKSTSGNAFIILGASGDLSRKKIYPTLWFLYRQKLMPKNTKFIGYARSKLTIDEIRIKSEIYMKIKEEEKKIVDEFFSNNHYLAGSYDEPSDFIKLNNLIEEISGKESNRIFYLALPPSVFNVSSEMIRKNCWPQGSSTWGSIIIEKPFGHDLESSNRLSKHISALFLESEIYRIDHYLGKEMVKNLLVLRFGNIVFRSLWDRDHISNIQITFKEPFGVEGRGGYFDSAGIIRDVIQNHLLQILSLVAMEKPISMNADDIRGEKLRVLRATKSLTLENLVIGQYVGNEIATDPKERLSYKDVKGVPADSITPTYACVVLYINNERWDGVPFILRCGKALNERKAEIRIQFKDVPGDIFAPGQLKRNELVIRVQPGEAIYIKMMTKQPGMPNEEGSNGAYTLINVEETELDLSYLERYKDIRVPDAYENLILDVFYGSQMDFVHVDELKETWRIVDQALKELVEKQIQPFEYKYGSRNGPPQATELIRRAGYVYSGTYVYPKSDDFI